MVVRSLVARTGDIIVKTLLIAFGLASIPAIGIAVVLLDDAAAARRTYDDDMVPFMCALLLVLVLAGLFIGFGVPAIWRRRFITEPPPAPPLTAEQAAVRRVRAAFYAIGALAVPACALLATAAWSRSTGGGTLVPAVATLAVAVTAYMALYVPWVQRRRIVPRGHAQDALEDDPYFAPSVPCEQRPDVLSPFWPAARPADPSDDPVVTVTGIIEVPASIADDDALVAEALSDPEFMGWFL